MTAHLGMIPTEGWFFFTAVPEAPETATPPGNDGSLTHGVDLPIGPHQGGQQQSSPSHIGGIAQ